MRLNQFLARAGVSSRRGADELIEQGLVSVNGQIARVGTDIDPELDKIEIMDLKTQSNRKNTLKIQEGLIYLVLNKPRGYTSTVKDRYAQRTVMDLVLRNPRVYPVGRLDRDSEGLLLFSNDGDFANAMMHPKFHIAKIYHVWVKGSLSELAMSRLSGGIRMEEGVAKAKVRVLREDQGQLVMEFVLYQGFNRQIRRMCESVGLEVRKLVRMKIGNVVLGDLARGKWRYLNEGEIKNLKEQVSLVQ